MNHETTTSQPTSQPTSQTSGQTSGAPAAERDSFATHDWVCEVCCGYNRHHIPQDGVPRQMSCQGCHGLGSIVLPVGPAARGQMRMRVGCLACGAEYDPALRGCYKCDGHRAEPAEGYLIAAAGSRVGGGA